jgi:predicted Rossmann fold flavoprotein
MSQDYDVIIIGAGAAGLFCAGQAGQRGRKVLLVDHAKKIAEKIRISGGGRCNFTNIHTSPQNFISQNPHFCKSALSRFTPQDFIVLVEKYRIKWHEKTLGQLFCDESSQKIIDMLLDECRAGGTVLQTGTVVESVVKTSDGRYKIKTASGSATADSVVIATGGLSIPKIGASKFGYDIARQFGLNVIDTRAGLVPLTFQAALLEYCKEKSGISVEACVTALDGMSFAEGLLFTHRGLSGPSILQISSYWQEGEELKINLAHGIDIFSYLKTQKDENPKQDIVNVLGGVLVKRLAADIAAELGLGGRIAELPDKALGALALRVNEWRVKPGGTEGYRTAEVTLGGVDTAELSSKTMEAKAHPGLYFIGEVVDVTGHLGGYNFQWAWASAYAAALSV